MAEFHNDATRGRRAAYVAVGTDGKNYTVTGQYGGQQESLLERVYRVLEAAAYALPGIFYMGKVHGVEPKAKKGEWTERNPNSRKAKINGNKGKKVKK